MITTAPIHRLATVDSTNLEALRLFNSGFCGPLWVIADKQVQGRGRQGRVWESDIGNLYASLLLPLEYQATIAPQLSFVVALAVSDVAVHFAPSQTVQLKWPNDCLLDGGKLAGILCETLSVKPLCVCIGCGINVQHAPEGLRYRTSCLAGETVSAVFDVYRAALAHRLHQWQAEGFAAISAAWQDRAIGIGESVEFEDGKKLHHGTLRGLADDGALRLDVNGTLKTFYAGDLTIPSLEHARRLRT